MRCGYRLDDRLIADRHVAATTRATAALVAALAALAAFTPALATFTTIDPTLSALAPGNAQCRARMLGTVRAARRILHERLLWLPRRLLSSGLGGP